MSGTELARHHATAFLDPRHTGPVEELRSRWDPLMARLIAAHVTLIYPEEIPDPAELEQLAARGEDAVRLLRAFPATDVLQ